MKKIIILFILLLASPLHAFGPAIQAVVSVCGVAAPSCTLYQSSTGLGDTNPIGSYRRYVGQKNFTVASPKEVCQLVFYVSSTVGNISAKTYYAEIWNQSGDNLGTLVAGGTCQITKSGADITTGWNTFTGFSCPLLSTGTYAMTISTHNALDSSNYAVAGAQSSSSGMTGYLAVWTNLDLYDQSGAEEAGLEVYFK